MRHDTSQGMVAPIMSGALSTNGPVFTTQELICPSLYLLLGPQQVKPLVTIFLS